MGCTVDCCRDEHDFEGLAWNFYLIVLYVFDSWARHIMNSHSQDFRDLLVPTKTTIRNRARCCLDAK